MTTSWQTKHTIEQMAMSSYSNDTQMILRGIAEMAHGIITAIDNERMALQTVIHHLALQNAAIEKILQSYAVDARVKDLDEIIRLLKTTNV